MEELNRKKKQLREAQEKLKSVHDDLQQKKQKKAELENEVDLCRFPDFASYVSNIRDGLFNVYLENSMSKPN